MSQGHLSGAILKIDASSWNEFEKNARTQRISSQIVN